MLHFVIDFDKVIMFLLLYCRWLGRGCNITSKQYVRPDKKGKKGSAKKFPLTTDESENNVRAHLPHRLAKTFFPLLMLWVDQGYKAFHCHREPFFRHQLNHGHARISPGFRQMVRSNKTWIRLNWIDSIKTGDYPLHFHYPNFIF